MTNEMTESMVEVANQAEDPFDSGPSTEWRQNIGMRMKQGCIDVGGGRLSCASQHRHVTGEPR